MNEIKDIQLKLNAIEVTTNQAGYSKDEIDAKISDLTSDINKKQDELISGQNIKTVNNQSLLGEGNIDIQADLTDYYTKNETDSKLTAKADKTEIPDTSSFATKTDLTTKVDKVEGKVLSSNDYTTDEKTKLAGLVNYDDTQIKQQINLKANSSDVYDKSETYNRDEIDTKISESSGGTVDLTDYYTKLETDTKLSLKADKTEIPDTSSFATKSDLITKVDKSDMDSKLALKADKSEIPDTSSFATKTELAIKANSSDIYLKTETYNRTEIDKKIADASTGGTGTTSDGMSIVLRWDETQATEERAQLYTKLLNKFYENENVTVFLNFLDGSSEYIVDVNTIYKDNSVTKNELKLYGVYVKSTDILSVEVTLKNDGSFTIKK
jgi:hypothetical protein